MTTAAQVISIARSQIGVVENPYGSNYTKYGWWYGWNGVFWCDQFISWCFNQAGGLSLMGGKSASVALTASRMRNMGRYGLTPRVGSLAIFNNYSHIELVTTVGNGWVRNIGGNTSDLGGGSVSNGGGVFANTRNLSMIRGYCYPAYTGTASVPRPAPTSSGDLRVDGVLGPTTYKKVQRWVGVAQDGVFGTGTKKALQRKLRVTADGNFGPTSVRALQRVIGTHQDGSWGSGTTRALQTYLNRIF